jgi:hypothetical protein
VLVLAMERCREKIEDALGGPGRGRKKRRRNTGAGGNLLDAVAAWLALNDRETI